MQIYFKIEEDDLEDIQEYTSIRQTLEKNEDNEYCPSTTELQASCYNDATWMNVLRKAVETIEQHYGYGIKNDIQQAFADES